jgi:cold shock CspA family protein/ribosome-associated translation inhibitor RaiA
MKLEPQITFRNLPHSEEMAAKVRTKVAELEEFCGQIGGCRVVVEVPHRHHERGNFYHVRIDLTVPGKEIVVNREPDERTTSKSFDAALRDAFAAADRRLEDYVRLRRGQVKTHETLPRARVRAVMPHANYGFLESSDGRQIYFHRRSVVNARFDDLVAGTEVSFVEEQGDKGPQASTVEVVGRCSHVRHN